MPVELITPILQRAWRLSIRLSIAVALWMAMIDSALARRRDEPKEEPEPAWSLSYVIILFFVITAMVLICRPSGRKKRAANED